VEGGKLTTPAAPPAPLAGAAAKMMVYPCAPHRPQEPKFPLDIMRRHIDWIEKCAR
jgi:hypothetical protein